MRDPLSIALAALAAVQSKTVEQIQAERAARSATVQAESSKLAARAAKAEKISATAKEVPTCTPFPKADPLAPDSFLIAIRQGDVMSRLSASHGLVAWLRLYQPKFTDMVSPDMAPGSLLDALRLMCAVIAHPETFLAEPDRSNRNGTVVVFGAAGTTAGAEKMQRGMVSLLLQAEHLSMELECESEALSDMAADAAMKGNTAEALDLNERSLLAKGQAAIETARAESLRNILESSDVSQMAAMYDALGARTVEVTEEVISVTV